MTLTPAEIVSAYSALIGSPIVGVMVWRDQGPWALKMIALAALAGLLFATIRRLRSEVW